MVRYRKSKRNEKSILTGLSAIILTVINGLMGIIVTRVILIQFGSDFNGLNSTTNQIVNMMLILEGGFTLASNVALFSPLGERNLEVVNGILAATESTFKKIGIIFFVSGIAVSFLYAEIVNSDIERQLIFIIVVMAIIPQAINLYCVCKYRILLQAVQKEYIINVFTIVTIFLSHFVNIITIPVFKEMWMIRFVTMTFSIVNCILIIAYVKKKYDWIDFRVKKRRDLIVGTKDVIVQKITGVIYSSAPIVFLSITTIGGTKIASVYAIYNCVFSIVKSILHGIIDAPKQGLGQIIKESDEERLWRVFKQYEYVAIYAMFCFITTTFVMIMPFVKLYTKNIDDINYEDFGIAFLMIMITIVELLHIPSGQLINMSGKFNVAKRMQLLAAGVIIVAMLFFGYMYGIYGFLVAVLVTAILLAFLEIRYVHTIVFTNRIISWAKLVCPLLVGGIIIGLVEHEIEMSITGYTSFFACAISFFLINVLLGALIGFVFNHNVFIDVFGRFKSMIVGEK